MSSQPNLADIQELLATCPGCGGADLVEESDRNDIYSCNTCGLIFTNPRPSEQFVQQNYCEGGYYANFKPDDNWLGMWRRRIARVTRCVPGGGRVLDVSAGIGTGLMLLREQGYEIHGSELSTEAIGRAKSLYGIDLTRGYIEDLTFPPAHFDAITLWHVFEHLPYPARSLPRLVEMLKPGGHLIIAVPNNSQGRLALRPGKWSLSRARRLEALVDPVPYEQTFSEIHMIHFTPASLRHILENAGLEVREMSHDNISLRPSRGKDLKYAIRNLGARYLGIFMHKALFVCARKPS
ncbi:MAG: methyltransferase domain-containing protein [Zoogloeaceae bacterium]|nr:methyltransferase domain-containing protein [Zoogloeaceae bacterium]